MRPRKTHLHIHISRPSVQSTDTTSVFPDEKVAFHGPNTGTYNNLLKGSKFELIILVFRPIVHKFFPAKNLTSMTYMAATSILSGHAIEQRRKYAPKIDSLIMSIGWAGRSVVIS